MRGHSNARDDVKLLAVDLHVGESTPLVRCPFCGGSQSNPISFSVTRIDTGLLYNCYRASCSARGFVPSLAGELAKVGGQPKKHKAKPYTRETVSMPDDVYAWLWQRFGLMADTLDDEGWRWNEETQRIIMPIRNLRRAHIGDNARYWSELDRVGVQQQREDFKAITYWFDSSVPKYHSPMANNGKTSTLVLVEDMPSAVRLANCVDTVALLGTNIEASVLQHILSFGFYSRIVICLDADATTKALKMRNRFSLFVNRFDVLPLDGPDIKDMTNEEFYAFAGGLSG